jgi:hypothetical protein
VNAQISQAIGESIGDMPQPQEPYSDPQILLPGGVYWDGKLLRTAEVREMTGEDEEELARVKGSLARWMSVLLERCVVRIGDMEPTPALIRKLLIGDRDALVLGVRIATFGPDITASHVQCPHCEEFFSATVDLSTLDCARIEDPRPRHEYEVELRHERTAIVRLPDGEAQEQMLMADEATLPERETTLLAHAIVRVVDASGQELSKTGADLAKSLPTPDRRRIIRHIVKYQPGPKLDDIRFTHDGCGKEVSLPIEFGDLFRGE